MTGEMSKVLQEYRMIRSRVGLAVDTCSELDWKERGVVLRREYTTKNRCFLLLRHIPPLLPVTRPLQDYSRNFSHYQLSSLPCPGVFPLADKDFQGSPPCKQTNQPTLTFLAPSCPSGFCACVPSLPGFWEERSTLTTSTSSTARWFSDLTTH